mgnify:FL=1
MKRTALAIALLPAAVMAFAQEPAITFEDTSHDFGTIAEDGGNVTHEFKFTNTGDAPLMIVNASASCGCTRPSYPKKPVAPGKTDKIKVTYVPVGRPGEFVKTVTVKTNVKKQKTIKLKIKGTVVPKK